MATWHPGWEVVHFGDRFGNPMTAKIGLVTVNKQTKVGVKTWPGTTVGPDTDPPDRTMDELAISDVIAALRHKRSELIKATGGFR